MDFNGKLINGKYLVTKKIGEDQLSMTLKGMDVLLKKDIQIKFFKTDKSSYSDEDLMKFVNDTNLFIKLKHPNICRILEAGQFDDSTFIVTEPVKGEPLNDLIARQVFPGSAPGNKFNIILNIIIQLSYALHFVHQNDILHGNITPENIFIEYSDGSINTVLSGFGLYILKKSIKSKSREEILNTYSYMSPESSGIINYKIDERSDLYSLGVLTYQLLTGDLPFKGKTVDAIFHESMAVEPQPPSKINENISNDLNKIILKLINKNRSDRYQSAKGLLIDLRKILHGETGFTPGSGDRGNKLYYSTHLIGRNNELILLKNLFNKSRESLGEVCLIGGEIGSGKTRLVEELRSYIFNNNGIFIKGKCFANESRKPYQVFNEALDEYILQFRNFDKNIQDEIKQRINKALGQLGAIITNLNPDAKDLISCSDPLIKLRPERENERFLETVSQFFCSIGTEETPVVLFLDDLQWADDGSLLLLSEIIEKIKNSPLCIFGTYRNTEVHAGHTLYQIKSNNPDIINVILELFNTPKVKAFISTILKKDDFEIPETLIKYLIKKGNGNPYFTTEIIRQLVDEDVIKFEKNEWKIDVQKLDKVAVPLSIVEIILRRIMLLGPGDINILSAASVMGVRFRIDVLYKISQLSKAEIFNIIEKAIKLQFIEKDPKRRDEFMFVHDRVFDVFYNLLEDEGRKSLHQIIADYYEENQNFEDTDLTFLLAHHYITCNNIDKSLQYSQKAGNLAKKNYANKDAIGYYKFALNILEQKDSQNLQNDKWIDISRNLGEIYLTIGRNDEAINIFEQLLPVTGSNIEKANLYKEISTAYFHKGNWPQCEKYGKDGLKYVNERLPLKKPLVILSLALELLFHVFAILFPGLLIPKKKSNDPEKDRITIWFYITLNWTYVLSDIEKCIRSVLRMLNIAERKFGESSELALSMAAYAGLCSALPLFERSIKYNNHALNIRKSINDEWGIAQSLQFLGFCHAWMGKYSESLKYFEESNLIFKKIGDIKEQCMSLYGLVENHWLQSNYSKCDAYINELHENSRKSKDSYGISLALLSWSINYIETGDFKKAKTYAWQCYNYCMENKLWFPFCRLNLNLSLIYLKEGDIDKAIEYIEKAKDLFEKNEFLRQYVVSIYPYLAEIYIAEFMVVHDKSRLSNFFYKRKIRNACKTALKKTAPWASNHGQSLRVYAKYNSLIGRNGRARAFHKESIKHNKDIGRPYELAKSYFEYGLFLKEIKNYTESKSYIELAYNIFSEIGSLYYMKLINNI